MGYYKVQIQVLVINYKRAFEPVAYQVCFDTFHLASLILNSALLQFYFINEKNNKT